MPGTKSGFYACSVEAEEAWGRPDYRAPVISRAITDSELRSLPRQRKPYSTITTSWVTPPKTPKFCSRFAGAGACSIVVLPAFRPVPALENVAAFPPGEWSALAGQGVSST